MGLSAAIVSGLDAWKAIYDSVEPQNETLPAPWATRLDGFQKILVLRLLRPDKVRRTKGFEEGTTLCISAKLSPYSQLPFTHLPTLIPHSSPNSIPGFPPPSLSRL